MLAAARNIVRRGGVGELTISALTLEAGVSRPVVYRHFPNSQAIGIALLDDYFITMTERVAENAQHAQTLEEYIAIAIATQFSYYKEYGFSVRSLTNGHLTSEALNVAYLRLRKDTVETFADLLLQQGTDKRVAHAAGFALAELITVCVPEFSKGTDTELLQNTLTDMVLGLVHSVLPTAPNRPYTPELAIERSRSVKSGPARNK